MGNVEDKVSIPFPAFPRRTLFPALRALSQDHGGMRDRIHAKGQDLPLRQNLMDQTLGQGDDSWDVVLLKFRIECHQLYEGKQITAEQKSVPCEFLRWFAGYLAHSDVHVLNFLLMYTIRDVCVPREVCSLPSDSASTTTPIKK